MEGLSHLQQFAGNNAEIIPGQIVDPNMKDEVQIILIITGIASTPLKAETVAETISKHEQNAPRVYSQAVQYNAEPEQEKEPEMAYSMAEHVSYKTTTDRIIPSEPADIPSYTPSAAADAAFDTIMEPLGLSGIESSSRKVSEKHSDLESVDLDTPTFLRRRM